MLNRSTFRIILLALALALCCVAAIYSADAQDQPRPTVYFIRAAQSY
jgi:hypothetical protein